MRRRGKIQALFAVLLTLVMLIGSIPTDAIAVQAEEEPAEITAFDEPGIELKVEVGTKVSDIPFPEKLMAQLANGESKEIPVTWEDTQQQYNMEEAGTYTFTVKLGDAYTFVGTLPVAQVTVTKEEADTEAIETTEAPVESAEVEEVEPVSSEEESEQESAPAEYSNKISGFVWADKVLDGNYDPNAADENNREWVIEGYQVYLLKAEDQSVVAETTTDAEGKYEFTNIEPGKYMVKPHYNTPDTGDYRRSRIGIVGQNKIEAATGTTAVLDVLEDSTIENQDIGMKVKPNFNLSTNATYTIDISNATTVANSISTQTIPGVSIASNVLTFASSVDPTDTYILTGTTSAVRVVASTGVNTKITLGGVNMTGSVSPFQLSGTAKVNLTISGTNTLRCVGYMTVNYQAGLHVDPAATLTIGGTESDIINVIGGKYSAGIGSGYSTTSNCGVVNITGGTVNAWGGESGAGIGSGWGGAVGTINISGGVVTATGGNVLPGAAGAGIGGGRASKSGTINISGGTVTAKGYYGAGIGGGVEGASVTVNISGGTVTATGGDSGAGIGGSHTCNSGNITISGTADVTAFASAAGAGIGAGVKGNVENITISGGTVKSYGASNGGGAGIGGSRLSTGVSGNIRITGGKVLAQGGNGAGTVYGGSGIGCGQGGARVALLEIGAGAEIYAYCAQSAQFVAALAADVITGTGYYVNAYFPNGVLSFIDNYELRIHNGNYVGSYIGTIPFPTGCNCFAYTTGGSAKIYHTRGVNVVSGVDKGQVVDYDTNDYNVLLSKNGGSVTGLSDLYKVKLSGIPFLGDLSHDNVTQTTADLISTDHTFSLGTNNYGCFDYDLNGSFASGLYTRVPWSSTTVNPYTEHLTGLTPNTMYYYRNYIRNEYGDLTSATQKLITLPQISSRSATGNSVTDSIVSGSIRASANNNPITGVEVTIATNSSFTSGVQTKTLTSGASTNGYTDTSFTANFGVLAAGTYYVKVEVSNVSGALGGVTTETFSFVVASVYTITEKYVGRNNGTAIDSVGLPDTTAYVANGFTYTPASGIPPAAHTVGTDTYTYRGYKLDSYTPGDPISSGTPSAVAVSTNRTVYYIYEVLVDVGISKTVTGAYGDPNKLFDIKVTLKDGSNAPVTGVYSYTGSAIGGVTPPVSGSITFNGAGEGIIRLKHGQTITIKNIPKGYTYTVQETDAAITSGLYDVTYSGTGTVTGSGASAVISQTLGSTAAAISITNNRSTVPASGIKGSNYQMASVGILGALVVAALMFFGYRRRRKCR